MSALIAGSTVIGFAFGFILLVFTCVPELCPFKYRYELCSVEKPRRANVQPVESGLPGSSSVFSSPGV